MAYMPETGDEMNIIGAEDEVSPDNGTVVSSDGFAEYYRAMGSDINGDGNTESLNVLYAQTNVFTDIAMASQAGIEKLVRAQDDPFGVYKKSTAMMPGEEYEYRVTVTNSSEYALRDVVVFDRLENAIYDRRE